MTTCSIRGVGALALWALAAATSAGQSVPDKFRQLEEDLPTPNLYRAASGAPGPQYWQQRADYVIDVELDDENQKIIGKETITYTNKSPDPLRYIWLQLDNNLYTPDSDGNLTATAPGLKKVPFRALKTLMLRETFDGGVKVTAVRGAGGEALKHTVVKTMLRIDLPEPLKPGKETKFSVDWNYRLVNAKVIRSRSGYEYFKDDDNYIYEVAHWFPRLAAYTDVNGWQHKQFLGRGEFTLEFGDYEVSITAPEDHVVAATGELQNVDEVLTGEQRERLAKAKKTADELTFIVTPEEAEKNQKTKAEGKKTWKFKAENVRDFAFASSRKFIWDAQAHKVGGNDVLAMSFYPNEGEPLWSRYSTQAIIHTLNVYSRYTFDYPYPVAISVNGPVGGMEYPMICFNGPRPEKDGTYSKRTKYGLISVIIHEVGHNYFPMIVNSDERQWTWMDEGLNTFVQYLAEQEWEAEYPSRRGEPAYITGYMNSTNQMPIMTNSESLLQFGANAYAKPATALNILRETVLGRELFDHAFKEYARRWKFKRPEPADFFRTMEDASGIDLDWFWRGWFYSTDKVDIAIDGVRELRIDTKDPYENKSRKRRERDGREPTLSKERNKDLPKRADKIPSLKDFYNKFDELEVTDKDRKNYEQFLKSLTPEEKKLLETKSYFYIFDFKNVGGLVMPIIFKVTFEDGSEKTYRIPAEVWRYNPAKASKLIVADKPVKSVEVDPRRETADTDRDNNFFPPRIAKSRFELFKMRRGGSNPMRAERKREGREKKAAEKKKKGKKK